MKGTLAPVDVAVAGLGATLQALDAAQSLATSPTGRAGTALVVTIAAGGAALIARSGTVERGLSATVERPFAGVLYGLIAFGIVAFLGGYALSQLAAAGLGGLSLQLVGAVIAAGVGFALGGLGFAVVGAWVADAFDLGDPWLGLALVTAVSALAWLLLPFVPGLLVWLGIAALGIGGSTRRWIHSSQPRVAPE